MMVTNQAPLVSVYPLPSQLGSCRIRIMRIIRVRLNWLKTTSVYLKPTTISRNERSYNLNIPVTLLPTVACSLLHAPPIGVFHNENTKIQNSYLRKFADADNKYINRSHHIASLQRTLKDLEGHPNKPNYVHSHTRNTQP